MPALGTVEMHEALARCLDQDPDWGSLGGALDYSLIHVYTAPVDKSFFLRFDHGALTEVHEVADLGQESADFVLTAAPDVWKRVYAKIPNARASAFHHALSTGQIRFTGPFLQTYLKHSKAWEHLLEVVSLNKLVNE